MPIPFYRPSASPPNAFKNQPLPEARAHWLSKIFFHWITPILRVGYSRPLEADDLWTLTDDLQSKKLAARLHGRFMERLPPSKRSSDASSSPETSRSSSVEKQGAEESAKMSEKTAKRLAKGLIAIEGGRVYDMSLWKAIYRTIWREWWLAVVLNGIGSALRITSPLITRLIIEQLVAANAYHDALTSGSSIEGLERPRSVGYGVGLAIALFAMEFVGALFQYQANQLGAVQGCCLRAALIDLISRKSMRLSSKSRLDYNTGKITTFVTSDTSFMDWAFPSTVELPVQPLVIIAGIALLIYTLGYSALVGLGILIIFAPLQGWMFSKLIVYRKTQEAIVDIRTRLLTDVISNIRAVKLYAYETFFGKKVSDLRNQEMEKLQSFGLVRSLIMSTFGFLPILAAVLTFIVYGLVGNELNPAIIFSGLQFFNVLRMPISELPMILTSVIDAVVALKRIGGLLVAGELKSGLPINAGTPLAVDVQGSFEFEAADDEQEQDADGDEKQAPGGDGLMGREADSALPFTLSDIKLAIPKGALVCIVGRVGTGKSALLSGLINEMRQTKGKTIFGGSVSYVPQHAWVQSGTIMDNITFSAPIEQVNLAKVARVVQACGLASDLDLWPDREYTYIGEKGITLSGGQRQRICVARAAYADSDVVLLDDPLSTLDANVGHHLLQHCILSGPLSGRTRLLVTHHLDVLPRADWIVVMDSEGNQGRIVQQGTYRDLVRSDGLFKTLVADFGSASKTQDQSPAEKADPKDFAGKETIIGKEVNSAAAKSAVKLMLEEERETGEIKWSVYTDYLRAMGSWWWAVLIAASLLLEQIATVGNSLMLGFWSNSTIAGFAQGQYMAVYAGLGLAVAVFTFLSSYSMVLAGICASFTLFARAWSGVIHSPTSWHDRTPSGRIISRLTKDVQMLDDRVAIWWCQFLSDCLAVVGTFGLVVYTYPYLGLAFIPLGLFFYICAAYYRQTSRELKRLDSILRSHVYSSFGEQLSGVTVIRAFSQQDSFLDRLSSTIDVQNQAYVLSITCQRWLGVRLEFASQVMIMLIAIFGAAFRNNVNPAQFGVVLTYALSTAITLTNLVPLFAICEQEMNNAERIQHYTELESESASVLPADPPPEQWPAKGAIEFENVDLRYRPELPLVLKGVSFQIRPGEKVGVIGRTGAGKSSITQALFRMVEICGGGIWIDGRSVQKMGLETLRSRVAIIPQDAFLFEGKVRDNIDPLGQRDDAELNDLLNVIRNSASPGSGLREKFKLDAKVAAEGANFSAGERQLLSLVRALARRCKVLVLDEATSSVDLETDALIQRIIQTQLADVTLISIAHRLQTVAYYDRIIVMDKGRITETGPPLVLYDDTTSLFRRLCDTKRLGIRDILKIRDDASNALLRSRRAARPPSTRETPGRAYQQGSASAYLDVPTVFARFF